MKNKLTTTNKKINVDNNHFCIWLLVKNEKEFYYYKVNFNFNFDFVIEPNSKTTIWKLLMLKKKTIKKWKERHEVAIDTFYTNKSFWDLIIEKTELMNKKIVNDKDTPLYLHNFSISFTIEAKYLRKNEGKDTFMNNSINENEVLYEWRNKWGMSYNCLLEILNLKKPVYFVELDGEEEQDKNMRKIKNYLNEYGWKKYLWHHINNGNQLFFLDYYDVNELLKLDDKLWRNI